MPKTKAQKKDIIKSYEEKLNKAKSSVFISFKGLKVKDIEKFRKNCREGGAEYVVAKKTLMRIVFKASGLEVDPKTFAGDVGTIFSVNDEVFPAKTAAIFAKDHESMKILGGVLEKKFINEAKIQELSRLPSKQELLAKLVGSIQSPISGFVNVLAGNLRGLVQVLKAIGDAKK